MMISILDGTVPLRCIITAQLLLYPKPKQDHTNQNKYASDSVLNWNELNLEKNIASLHLTGL